MSMLLVGSRSEQKWRRSRQFLRVEMNKPSLRNKAIGCYISQSRVVSTLEFKLQDVLRMYATAHHLLNVLILQLWIVL